MSSIRLFVLDSFARHGDMHGHQLRLQAEQEHVHFWTDVSVGGLYGAIKRLAAEGLLAPVRTEREGSFPERQVYGITDAGRAALDASRRHAQDEIVLRPDPFDLALTRVDPDRVDELPATVRRRRAELERLLAESADHRRRADPWLSVAEKHALSHREHRLRAEISWHDTLIGALPDIVADEEAGARHALTGTPSSG
ncbi:helix-turn-helix transcriptional regulator [Frigoribacterium endophyticum]|uniref:helix-turn-helix transcriptional regulator n=1 Tax=Frigoribacterium endophyticum TaxID=1522176 RepID=UPI001ABB1259|nr:DNA-binding PadR family transcriptional regulator [Frigoribacterium endophyticum]